MHLSYISNSEDCICYHSLKSYFILGILNVKSLLFDSENEDCNI